MALVVQNADGTADKATGTLTFSSQPAVDDTVTLGSTTYSFQDTLVAANDVLRGADATASRDNLVSAINGTAGAGSTYATGTATNAEAAAAASGANLVATALHPGADGNEIESTQASSGSLSWADATLVDGADANAYITLAYFKAYHDARGNDYSESTDPQIIAAIVKATDYLDTRFSFRGIRLTLDQTTEFPRRAGSETAMLGYDVNFLTPSFVINLSADETFVALTGPNGEQILGIPSALKRACAEYGFRALSILLFQDAPAPDGGVAIESHSVKVDVIEESFTFRGNQSGGFQMPAYPAADLLLTRAGLIESGRSLMR